MNPEEFFNNSEFVTSDFLKFNDKTIGLNTKKLFDFAESYHKAKVNSISDKDTENYAKSIDMNAEEFWKNKYKDTLPQDLTQEHFYQAMENFLKYKVNSVSDEDTEDEDTIEYASEEQEMEHLVYSLGYRNGKKWFKEQLLKQ